MDRVTVYLRTSLFSLGGPDAHVPPGVMVIEGQVLKREGPTLTLRVQALLDERGRALSEEPGYLTLPWSKVDHLVPHELDLTEPA